MKTRAAAFLVSSWIVVSMCGCTNSGRPSDDKVVLPADVAGTWQARDDEAWRIVLKPNGRVSSAVIRMGEVEVRPNKTTRVEMADGKWSTFKTGDCVVEYTPATRELFVSIEMKKIHIRYMDNVVEGNSLDRFMGTVSEDGKVWMADWISVFDYGPRFPQEPNDIFAEPIVFDKIEE